MPAARRLIVSRVDELDASHVEAAGRLVEHEKLQIPAELPGDDDLLLVAARQRAGRDVGRGGPDVELGHAFLRTLLDGVVITHEAARVRRVSDSR